MGAEFLILNLIWEQVVMSEAQTFKQFSGNLTQPDWWRGGVVYQIADHDGGASCQSDDDERDAEERSSHQQTMSRLINSNRPLCAEISCLRGQQTPLRDARCD